MDPTQEFSAFIGNLGVQVVMLQTQNRLLQEEIRALNEKLASKTNDKNT